MSNSHAAWDALRQTTSAKTSSRGNGTDASSRVRAAIQHAPLTVSLATHVRVRADADRPRVPARQRKICAFVKAILCIYASFQTRSFDNSGIVHVANDTLKRANSRNYHHFFPRAYLKKIGVSDSAANNVFNITIIDAHLNKNQISTRSPLKYM